MVDELIYAIKKAPNWVLKEAIDMIDTWLNESSIYDPSVGIRGEEPEVLWLVNKFKQALINQKTGIGRPNG